MQNCLKLKIIKYHIELLLNIVLSVISRGLKKKKLELRENNNLIWSMLMPRLILAVVEIVVGIVVIVEIAVVVAVVEEVEVVEVVKGIEVMGVVAVKEMEVVRVEEIGEELVVEEVEIKCQQNKK